MAFSDDTSSTTSSSSSEQANLCLMTQIEKDQIEVYSSHSSSSMWDSDSILAASQPPCSSSPPTVTSVFSADIADELFIWSGTKEEDRSLLILPFTYLRLEVSEMADSNRESLVMLEEGNDADAGSDELEEVEEGPAFKKPRKRQARCWKHFTIIGEKGNEKARCNGCKTEYKIDSKTCGTSTLNRHIDKCTQIKHEDIGQVILDMQGKMKAIKIDMKVAREMYAEAVIEHDQPFNFAEYRKFKRFHNYLNPDWTGISRNTLKQDVLNLQMRDKMKLKKMFGSIQSRICLTSDLWTSCNTEGYVCLTAHFIDVNWKLNSKIIAFRHMPPPHTGFELTHKILGLLKEWGIEKKIFTITLDNASANDSMVSGLRNQLNMQKLLLCDGKFFHARCSAHILNLIVQDGVKVANDALTRIRESVKYIKGTESRMIKFKECIEQVGGEKTVTALIADVPTRWNSTYEMLNRALKFKRELAILQLSDRNYKYYPSEEEWNRLEILCRFLHPFCEITNLMSGTSYPTSNLYFLQVWKIQRVLIRMSNDEDVVVSSMANKMMDKFQKYWEDYSDVLSLGAILDPRIKFTTLSFCHRKIDAYTHDDKMENIKANVYKLFENYVKINSSTNIDQSQDNTHSSSQGSMELRGWDDEILDELTLHTQHQAINTGKSELDVYLEEPPVMVIDRWNSLDALQWWKDNSCRFPSLSLMARDLLSIPITTVASESAFSIGSRVLNKYRNKLLSKNVEALVCTRNWLAGFVANDDDDDEDGISHILASSRGSNSHETL
ncbi:zinc finger BED domain-containing protein RICESLEEPER 2-like [Gastrolobium bilobum]|uniref:zinc finger BED domain-containing protein RICESLEEPER 2-like n=1 Tax=Gastrolobium bilobum TaxID=150636 RepID=UPI002AB09C73|nr:zinc finger BED domain-containing protein RICESLEEPER 2-like [Gastrolobium bilobum]